MRKTLIAVLVLLLASAGSWAKDVNFEDLEKDIDRFAKGVASSLPLNSAVGLNWSDAYIGQFPHFGVGLTVGASTIPFEAAKIVLDTLDLTSEITGNEQLSQIAAIGMPLPAYTAEARLGGIILPFDAGVKIGILPPNYSPGNLIPGFSLDYMNVGFDVRVPLLQEQGMRPDLSVGGGYNYLRANVGFAGTIDDGLNIQSFDDPRPDVDKTYNVSMDDPTVNFQWSANVIDLKAQVSKQLLLFRPYAGLGASIGFGSAGSGFEAKLNGITEEEVAAINAWAEGQGLEAPLPELSDSSFYVNASMGQGWAVRAYGGFSIELLIVKLDLTGMYDFLGNNFGVTIGTRIQL